MVARNSSLHVFKGEPLTVWKELLGSYEIQAVYANKDYEPYALKRDRELGELLESRGIAFHLFKDQVIFEEGEIVKNDGKPYTVFTPYKRKWLEKFQGGASLTESQRERKRISEEFFFLSANGSPGIYPFIHTGSSL